MKMTVSDVARALEVDHDQLEHWAFLFKDYLTDGANPSTGMPRSFLPKDLPVLAYIADHWDDDPDLENIKVGLNCGRHRSAPYTDILTETMSLFQPPPEGLDEEWRHGVLLGGMASLAYNTFAIAESFKLAGDVLVDAIPLRAEAYELVHPAMFTYRHALELYLKATLPRTTKGHKLWPLWEKLRVHLEQVYRTPAPPGVENLIREFDDYDLRSTTFRYGDTPFVSRSTGDSGEVWIDLPKFRERMQSAAMLFEQIRNAEEQHSKSVPLPA